KEFKVRPGEHPDIRTPVMRALIRPGGIGPVRRTGGDEYCDAVQIGETLAEEGDGVVGRGGPVEEVAGAAHRVDPQVTGELTDLGECTARCVISIDMDI